MFANALSPTAPERINFTLQFLKLRFCWLSCVFLLGCATTKSIDLPEMPDWPSRQATLIELDEWEFAGRIGVSAGTEGFNGKIWWRQDGTVFRARISGPLGVGTVFINGNGPELTMTDRDGVVTELEDAETDLRVRYGWTIPVNSLRYWALGIPAPGTEADMTFEDPGELVQLRQDGWQVEFREYREGAGQSMPRRVSAVSGDVKVRLVIDEWTFRR